MDLATVIKILKEAPRIGQPEDKPEGVRYIQISDTLANEMIEKIEYTLSVSGPYGDH